MFEFLISALVFFSFFVTMMYQQSFKSAVFTSFSLQLVAIFALDMPISITIPVFICWLCLAISTYFSNIRTNTGGVYNFYISVHNVLNLNGLIGIALFLSDIIFIKDWGYSDGNTVFLFFAGYCFFIAFFLAAFLQSVDTKK